MKKTKLLLTAAASALIMMHSKSQTFTCSTTQYPSSTVTINSSSTTTITTCNYAGEYSVDNFTATGVYQISSTGGTANYITLTDNSNNILAQGNSPITVTITATGPYRIHINTNATCGTEGVCRTTIVSPVLNCANVQYPSTTTTISSTAPTTITICNYAGEYSVNDFTATGVYTLTATGGSTNYITFTDNTNAPLSQGYSPLTVTVNTAGLYRIHINTNNACGTESVCRTTVVTPLMPPINDDCVNATTITVPGTYTGTTIGATSEPTTVPTCSLTGLTQPGVWYSVTGNGYVYKADLCGTNWDSKMFVYTGTCGSLSVVGCNDDNGPGCTGLSSSVAWCTMSGTTYYILVTGYSSANNFTLSVNSLTPTTSVSVSPNPVCAGNSATITAITTPTDNSTWSYTLNPGFITFTSSTVVTPTTSTTYTLMAENNKYFMCGTNPMTVIVNVNSAPLSSTLVPSTYSLACSNSTASIVANVSPAGTYSYTWSGPGIISGNGTPTIGINQSGGYMVNISNACGTISDTVMINSIPSMSVSVNVTDATSPGCSNGSATVNVSGGTPAYTYSWSAPATGNVATNLSGTSGSGTTYSVIVTDANGCSAIQVFTVTCITGIESLISTGILNVYPNPNNGVFNIITNNNDMKYIKVMDVSGRIIFEGNTNDKDIIINISKYNSGMYLLEVNTNSGTARFNIIKE